MKFNRSDELISILVLFSRYLAINMYQHIEVWDLVKDEVLHNIYHPSPLNKIFVGSSGRLLVTAGFDFLLRLYDLRRVANENRSSVQNWPRTIDFFVALSPFMRKPNTRYTVLRSFWDYITVWDNETGKKVRCRKVAASYPGNA